MILKSGTKYYEQEPAIENVQQMFKFMQVFMTLGEIGLKKK